MATVMEQRKNSRTELAWPVSVWLPEANRFFNGHSANISKTGAFLSMPMTTPASEGHTVEINFPRTQDLAIKKGSYARIKVGRVVRVDRSNITDDAHVGVAIEFVH